MYLVSLSHMFSCWFIFRFFHWNLFRYLCFAYYLYTFSRVKNGNFTFLIFLRAMNNVRAHIIIIIYHWMNSISSFQLIDINWNKEPCKEHIPFLVPKRHGCAHLLRIHFVFKITIIIINHRWLFIAPFSCYTLRLIMCMEAINFQREIRNL